MNYFTDWGPRTFSFTSKELQTKEFHKLCSKQFILKQITHFDREHIFPFISFRLCSEVCSDHTFKAGITGHVTCSYKQFKGNKGNIKMNNKPLNRSIQKHLSTFSLWPHIKSSINVHIILALCFIYTLFL